MWHIYIYNWIFFSPKKEWNSAICSNMDKPLDYHIRWSETVSQFNFSVISDSATPWTAAHLASLSITNSWNLLKLMSIKSMMPANHLIFRHPILLLPSILPSIRVFSNWSVLCIRWPKHWSFRFSISLSNKYSRLIFKGLSRVFFNTTVQKHQFFGIQFSEWSNSHIHTWLLEKP